MFAKLIILATSLVLTVAQFNYCSISQLNTMCLYNVTTIGQRCTRVYSGNVSTAEQMVIVNAHNDLRRKVAQGLETRGKPGPQPPASNMRELVWDPELAAMAQTWAQQCTFGHDRNRNVGRFVVGQNIAIEMATAPYSSHNWASYIEQWYDEVNNMNQSYVTSYPANPSTGVIGHYTQTVWAETHKIGCGFVKYFDTSFYARYPFKQLYVCNYGPAGNVLYASVYKIGDAATACPKNTNASNYLCASITSTSSNNGL